MTTLKTPQIPMSLRPQRAIKGLRWWICGLLFFATTINYMDRQVIGVLKPMLMQELGWSEIDYGNIVFAFQLAYAIGMVMMGRIIDGIGVRIGLAVAVSIWSVAAIGHGFVRTVSGFMAARFGLGIAEAGNFPAAIKAVGEWFPKRERALATGIFNAGSNVGALVTPVAVPWIAVHLGWPWAFYLTGILGLLWLVGWWILYRSPAAHSRLDSAELAYLRSDQEAAAQVTKMRWASLFGHRQTWAFAIAKLLTDPIWWFYLFWIPGFLFKKHGLNLIELGPPLVVIYLMTDVGSIGGGWLSSRLLKSGWTANAARKTAMLVCALCVVPVFFASMTTHLWVATLLIGVAASAHQGFSANLFSIVGDTVPPSATSSVVGIGGMAGAVGGMGIAKFAGYILESTGSYFALFAIASMAYLVALAVIHVLLPRLELMDLSTAAVRADE